MSFSLINPIDGSVVTTFLAKWEAAMLYPHPNPTPIGGMCSHKVDNSMELDASRNMFIEPLSTCAIPHKVHIECHGEVWLARLPIIFISHCLMVDQGPVESGEIITYVFNYSSARIIVHKGQSVSKLVAL